MSVEAFLDGLGAARDAGRVSDDFYDQVTRRRSAGSSPASSSRYRYLTLPFCCHVREHASSFPFARNEKAPPCGAFRGGRYWARTSDPQLVELVLSQLS